MLLRNILRASFGLFILAVPVLQALSQTAQDPVYHDPFPVPAWLEKPQRLVFDIHAEEKWASQGATLSCLGTNASAFPFVWDGKDRIYSMEDGKDADMELYRKEMAEARRVGVRVLCPLMRFWHPDQLINEHPEWQELPSADSKPVTPADREKNPHVMPSGCWISPFGDFYIQQCAIIARKFGWDGYNLDGFGTFTICHCPTCSALYPKETGHPLPKGADVNDIEFRRYSKWRMGKWNDFVYRWQKGVKAVNPDFAAIPWSTGPGRWWQWMFAGFAESSDASNRLVDAPILELFWDFPADQGNSLLSDFTVRYYRGLTAERPLFMLSYLCSQGQQLPLVPQAERDYRLTSVIANGATPALGVFQLGVDQSLTRQTDVLKAREPWTEKAKSIKWAAMLVSESSRMYYGLPGQRGELTPGRWIGSGVDSVADISKVPASQRRMPIHMESALGVFRAMGEAHLPLDIITEQDVDQGKLLNDYKVLILPSAACLSDAALRNIRAYVQQGGGLVAFHQSSLCNELGEQRADFGLADLFGASYSGVEDHTVSWPHFENTTHVLLGDHVIDQDPAIVAQYRHPSNKTLDYIGLNTLVKPAADAQVIAWYGAEAPIRARLDNPKADAPETRPLILTHQAGKGKVVYFAADIGQSYFVMPYVYERPLITNAIHWAASDQQPTVSVDAPRCVEATFYQQTDHNRLVVHLLNETNTTGDRAMPNGNPPVREEVLPIHDIRVTFTDPQIKKVTQEPEHRDLPISRTTAGIEVTVPDLEIHSMVVAEK